MSSGLNIALLGGSFDPPHRAHLEVADYLLQRGDFDEVWVVPTQKNPLKPAGAAFEQRVAMCRLAFAALPKVQVRTEEAGLSGYTIDLIQLLKKKFPRHRFVFVGGTDLRTELPRWKDAEKLQNLIAFEYLPRPPEPGSPFSPIRSTDVRERVKKGLPIDALTPKAVEAYIHSQGLYR